MSKPSKLERAKTETVLREGSAKKKRKSRKDKPRKSEPDIRLPRVKEASRNSGPKEAAKVPCGPHQDEPYVEIPTELYEMPPNIWDDPPECEFNIVYLDANKNGYSIKSANLHKLVQKLTSSKEVGGAHEDFVRLFFLTYRAYASAKDILARFIQIYEGPPEGWKGRQWIPLATRRFAVCFAMKHWFKEHYKDFTDDDELMKTFTGFVQKSAKVDGDGVDPLMTTLNGIVEKKLSKGTYVSMFDSTMVTNNPPEPRLPKDWTTASFMDLDDLEIARQLTIAESHIYLEIQPVELQDLAWSKAKLKHRAQKVLELIEKFNTLSAKVCTSIVTTKEFKKRKSVAEKWVRIANICVQELNNFNSAMAILSGFANSAAYRLKHTWGNLNKKVNVIYEQIQELTSSSNAYKLLRERVASITSPAIPFLGMYLTDLTFVEDGNPNRTGGLINFRKRQLEYNIMVDILQFQDKSYDLKIVPKMVSFLNAMPVLDEKTLYDASLVAEPRGCKKKELK